MKPEMIRWQRVVVGEAVKGPWAAQKRLEAGISQKEMAAFLQVKPAYVCDLEHNRRNFKPAIWDKYEAAIKAAKNGK